MNPLRTLMDRRALLVGGAVSAVPLLVRAQGVGQGNQQPEITVDRARTAPIPIAVPNFTGTQLGVEMTGGIANNRGVAPARAAPGRGGRGHGGAPPNSQTCKAGGAQALVPGRVEGGGSNVRA